MNFIALILLGLMGTVCSSPVCLPNCRRTPHMRMADFKHVPDLQTSSVAPWNMIEDIEHDREPAKIMNANCRVCNVVDMVAKPILLEIYVYYRTNSSAWCRCPYDLAVGCTCVKNE